MLTNFPNVLGAYNSANIFNSIALKLNFTNIMGNALIVCKLQWSQQRQSWPLSNTNILCLKQLSFHSFLYLSRCQVLQEGPHLRIINKLKGAAVCACFLYTARQSYKSTYSGICLAVATIITNILLKIFFKIPSKLFF